MDFGTTVVAIAGVLLGIAGPILLVGIILWYKARQTRMVHETALQLAAKGHPVPPELFAGADTASSDLRRGVVLIGLGLALATFMFQVDKPWSIGLIPLFMGLGYLVVWKLETGKPKKDRA